MADFRDLIGQAAAVGELRRERERGRLAHAYLFEGLPGTGRLTLARALAWSVLCGAPSDDGACGRCRACRLLASGNHPDLLELPRDTGTLPLWRFVERADRPGEFDDPPVLSFLHLRPAEGARRVVVIPDAERMNAEAANALLKTLEEPPAAGLLLLTTSARERLPATVVSRCRRFGVGPLSPEAVAGELRCRGAAADEAGAARLAALAEGSLGLALTLSGGTMPEDWEWLTAALRRSGAGAAEELARGWIERLRGGDAAERRRQALRWLDVSALALRGRLREGEDSRRIGAALAALWRAAEQVDRNVRLELLLMAAAAEVVSALGRRPPP